MKTFDPPSKNMESDSTPGDEGRSGPGAAQGAEADYLDLCTRGYPAARRAAVASIVPGLGQLINGEIAKGTLFLTVTAANLILMVTIWGGNFLKPLLTATAQAFQRQPNWELGEPLHAGLLHSPALSLYGLCMVAFIAYAMRDAYDGAVQVIRRGGKLPKAQFTISEATSGSYLGHITIIVALALAEIIFIIPPPPHKQIINIEFNQPKPVESRPAPKPAPKRELPKPIVKPIVPPKPVVQPKPVQKVVPPKPTPVAVAVPTKDPSPLSLAPVESAAPPPATAPDTGSQSGGNQGGTGAGGHGDAEVDMGPYMKDLQKRIKQHWYPPKGNENKRIKVSFKIFKDGHITKLKLIISSGVSEADDAAMAAVKEAAPFATLPDGVGDDVDINFSFDYHVFGSGGRGL